MLEFTTQERRRHRDGAFRLCQSAPRDGRRRGSLCSVLEIDYWLPHLDTFGIDDFITSFEGIERVYRDNCECFRDSSMPYISENELKCFFIDIKANCKGLCLNRIKQDAVNQEHPCNNQHAHD